MRGTYHLLSINKNYTYTNIWKVSYFIFIFIFYIPHHKSVIIKMEKGIAIHIYIYMKGCIIKRYELHLSFLVDFYCTCLIAMQFLVKPKFLFRQSYILSHNPFLPNIMPLFFFHNVRRISLYFIIIFQPITSFVLYIN